MAESGTIPCDQVIHVLVTALTNVDGVSVFAEGKVVLLVKDGVPDVQVFDEIVTRRHIMRLAHKYGIRVEWFWRPEMIHKPDGNTH